MGPGPTDRSRATVLVAAMAVALAVVATGRAPATSPPPAPTTAGRPRALGGDSSVLGLRLSGTGTTLRAPTSPTYMPYRPDCRTLFDPAFTGKCVVAVAPGGTVAAVVEEETAATSPANKHPVQERDLVWRRRGARWELALVRTFDNPGLPPTHLWADDIERDGDTGLVFVTASVRSGFGNELDVVAGTGKVTLFRFLGEGFAVVPPAGGIVTYVPTWTEKKPVGAYWDQVLIGHPGRSWRVFSQQYVPDAAALGQHRHHDQGAFWDRRAVPAS